MKRPFYEATILLQFLGWSFNTISTYIFCIYTYLVNVQYALTMLIQFLKISDLFRLMSFFV